MKLGIRRRALGKEAEMSALIATLHASEQRLEELTGGEVDTVADRNGRTLLLQNAQSQLRHSDAERQAALLNALPAQVALLDPQGFVLAVNDAWSRFGGGYSHSTSAGIGINYADACGEAPGEDRGEALAAAAGIRSVLAGEVATFSIDFSCPSPAGVNHLRMTVTPMSGERLSGAVVMNVDVTREKQAQGVLRESERRFSGLLGSIQMASVTLDTRGHITYCNDYLLRLAGWSLDEVVGRDWFDTFMPPELGDMKPVFAQLLRDLPETWHRQNEIVTRTGERRLLRWNNSVLRSGDGAVIGTASIGEDITEQRRIEDSLQQNEQRTRSIVDSALDAVVVMDAEGRIIDWNPQAERTFGWPREDALGRLVAETIIPVAYREEHARGLRRFLETGAGNILNKSVEISALHRDGHRIPVELSIRPIKLSGEWIFSSFIRDLTQRKRGEHDLQSFASAIDATSDSIYMVDRDTMSFLHVNDAACRMQGMSREELMAHGPAQALSDSGAGLEQIYDAIIESGEAAAPVEMRWSPRNGPPRWIEVRRHAQRSGGRWMVVAIVRDISDRKEAETRIRRLNRLYAVLSGINSLVLRVADRAELFREACRICVEQGALKAAWIGEFDLATSKGAIVASNGEASLLGDAAWLTSCDEKSARERPACRALRESKMVICDDVETDPSLADVREELLRRGCRSLAFFPLGASGGSGRLLALFAGEAGVFDAEETRLLMELAGDITHALDHIGKKEQLDYIAYYDALTGLANRTLFLERLAQYLQAACVGGHKLALFLLDLERFKNINDSFGWPAGDALLQQVAEWLSHAVGQPHQLARIGANQFALVMPEVKQEGDAARFLEKAMNALRRHPFRMGQAELRLSAKVGIAVFPDDGAAAQLLCDRAEAALKKAKASGERYLFHTQTMTEMVAGRVTLENQLRHALEKDEFVLHYQPKVNSASGTLTGVEALIRWNDPLTGLVPPFSFIPLLEETGLIHEVGRWALRKAIEDYLRWHAAGFDPPRVAVNVSPLQLRHRDFVAEIAEAIGIDPRAAHGLELEVTESLIMEDVQHSITTLEAIRAMGVRVAIDDFGTGYSSLSYLSKLPVDAIKIDRSFVVAMTTGEQGLALVSTIVNLGHSLKLTIVAEGVETEQQAACLRKLGCDEMQGFLFCKPVPRAILEQTCLGRSGPQGDA